MKSKFNKTILGATSALTLAGTLPAQEISVNGNLKYFQKTGHDMQSYPEYNAWISGLPGKARVYGWGDLNEDGSYFGKTEISRGITKNISAVAQAVHANRPFAEGGLGLQLNIPMKKSDRYGNVKVLPVWVNRQGESMPGNALFGYAFGRNYDNGWDVSTFAEFNINAPKKEKFTGKRSFRWGYGEIEVNRQMGPNLKIGLNAGLYFQGMNKFPEIEARVQFRHDFGFIPFWKRIAE